MTRIFVYGSLLSGERNHRVLGGARRLSVARTVAAFSLFDLGAFPAMTAGGRYSVLGEVYEIDEASLGRVDALEGHPRFYQRTAIELARDGHAETYLLPLHRAAGNTLITSGDWRAWQRRREPALTGPAAILAARRRGRV